MIRTRLHCDLPGALLNFTNLETFEDWKKSPSFLEAALYIRPHSLIGRSKKLKNFIEAAAYQRSFTVCLSTNFLYAIYVQRECEIPGENFSTELQVYVIRVIYANCFCVQA